MKRLIIALGGDWVDAHCEALHDKVQPCCPNTIEDD